MQMNICGKELFINFSILLIIPTIHPPAYLIYLI